MHEQRTPRPRRGASFSHTSGLKRAPTSPRAGSQDGRMNRNERKKQDRAQKIQRVNTLAESVAAALRPSYGLIFREPTE